MGSKTYILSDQSHEWHQSGIRAASVRCREIGGINLGQGVCDLPTPRVLKQAASDAVDGNKNLYSACAGLLELRQAIADKLQAFNQINADPLAEIVVTHGSTGAFVCAIQTLFNPGDEVILFEPFYGYHKNILGLMGVVTKVVAMDLADFQIDLAALQAAITPKTRGIVICTPCNPSGKVFSREELLAIGAIAKAHDLMVVTDEIYEYITYPGYEHVSYASLDDFQDHTVTISGFSKTYNMTGWRMGYASGPAPIIEKMALVQDLLYVCPATPLQNAVLAAFTLSEEYYRGLQRHYLEQRDLCVSALRRLGFKLTEPQGAYYLMADFTDLGFADDEQAANHLLEQAKVATVTGRSFYLDPEKGRSQLRFCYALSREKVATALEQIESALTPA